MTLPVLMIPGYQISCYSILLFAAGFAMLLLGLFVLSQNWKSHSHIALSLVTFSCFVWLTGTAVQVSTTSAETAYFFVRFYTNYGVFAIAPSLYFFSITVGEDHRPSQYWLMKFGYLLAAGFGILNSFTALNFSGVELQSWGYWPVIGRMRVLYHIFFTVYYVMSLVNFYQAYKNGKDSLHRKQYAMLLIAFLIAMFGSIDYLAEYKINFLPLGFVFILFFVMVMFYSIIRYKLLDIETVIHKTLMWLLSTAVAVIPFAVLIYFSQNWIKNAEPLALTVFTLTMLIGFYAYLRAVRPRLNQIFRRRHADLQSALTRFSSQLAHLMSLRDLLQGFARMIRSTLYTGQVSVYLRNPQDDNQLMPVIVKRIRGLKPVTAFHPFLIWLEKSGQVVMGDLLRSNPEVAGFRGEVIDYFAKTKALVAMPFIHGGKLIGVAHLGKKDGVRRYTHEEMVFLSQLMAPMTVAFSNSLHFIRMQENLERFNVELERKVEERTQQLQETQAQLVQAEKLATIGTLAGGVAHEINNPLTAVLTNAQILKMTAVADDLESIALIEEGAKRCQSIVQKLMKYSRKPMGAEVMGRCDLNKVVDSAIAFLKYQLEQENIRTEITKDANLPVIEGNANELEQVLTNLILNAKDAIKAAGRDGLIKISTSEQGDSVCLKVEDNGVGIPKENLQKIFDPFYTTKELGKGTGLGLAVSFGIIQKHNGMINVNSELNMGTAFIVRLPQLG